MGRCHSREHVLRPRGRERRIRQPGAIHASRRTHGASRNRASRRSMAIGQTQRLKGLLAFLRNTIRGLRMNGIWITTAISVRSVVRQRTEAKPASDQRLYRPDCQMDQFTDSDSASRIPIEAVSILRPPTFASTTDCSTPRLRRDYRNSPAR